MRRYREVKDVGQNAGNLGFEEVRALPAESRLEIHFVDPAEDNTDLSGKKISAAGDLPVEIVSDSNQYAVVLHYRSHLHLGGPCGVIGRCEIKAA